MFSFEPNLNYFLYEKLLHFIRAPTLKAICLLNLEFAGIHLYIKKGSYNWNDSPL
jgi:hypothetical protein